MQNIFVEILKARLAFEIKSALLEILQRGMSNQARASVAGEPLKDTLPALHLSQQPPRSVDCAHVPLTESSPSQGQRGSAWLQYGFTLHREALFLLFFLNPKWSYGLIQAVCWWATLLYRLSKVTTVRPRDAN